MQNLILNTPFKGLLALSWIFFLPLLILDDFEFDFDADEITYIIVFGLLTWLLTATAFNPALWKNEEKHNFWTKRYFITCIMISALQSLLLALILLPELLDYFRPLTQTASNIIPSLASAPAKLENAGLQNRSELIVTSFTLTYLLQTLIFLAYGPILFMRFKVKKYYREHSSFSELFLFLGFLMLCLCLIVIFSENPDIYFDTKKKMDWFGNYETNDIALVYRCSIALTAKLHTITMLIIMLISALLSIRTLK